MHGIIKVIKPSNNSKVINYKKYEIKHNIFLFPTYLPILDKSVKSRNSSKSMLRLKVKLMSVEEF